MADDGKAIGPFKSQPGLAPRPATARGLHLGAAPDWFEWPPFDRIGPPPVSLVEGGTCIWLTDTQVSLVGPEQTTVHRLVQEVVTSDGLQSVGGVEWSFDPSNEALVVHCVRVIRDGQVRETASLGAFEQLRRERDLERAIYDGRLTAHMLIPDLRVGDVVETCYSRLGERPSLKGVFSAYAVFEWSRPVAETRFRLLSLPSRALVFRTTGRTPPMQEVVANGVVRREWRSRELPPYLGEPRTPPGWIGWGMLQVADRMSWAEVADLFRAGYAPPTALPAELEASVEVIAARWPLAEQRVPAALRLVQGGLRYHAISVGDGGFTPRSVGAIWSTRFGDCKDASRVLTTVLRRLGVEADPALVDTHGPLDLDQQPPHSTAFNHCIVRVRVGGETYWLDPTNAPQSGRLDRLTQARFGWALPLTADAVLESMGEDEPVTVFESQEEVGFGRGPSSPATFALTTTYRGWRADYMRRRIANDGMRACAAEFLRHYQQIYGGVTELEPLTIDDRADDNELVFRELYQLTSPWSLSKDGRTARFETVDEVFQNQLTTPRTPRRLAPIDSGPPRKTIQDIRLVLPRTIDVTGWAADEQTASVRGVSSMGGRDKNGAKASRARTIVLRNALTIRHQVIPAAEAQTYFDFCERMRQNGSLAITLQVRGGAFVGPRKPWWSSASGLTGGIVTGGRLIWLLIVLAILVSQAIHRS